MASVLDQLPNSTLSLVGNGFTTQTHQPAWGYSTGGTTSFDLLPERSTLQYTYSVDGNPNQSIIGFNRAALGGWTQVRPPAHLDELDPFAPNNTVLGVRGGIYKSPIGRRYKDLGPPGGRY